MAAVNPKKLAHCKLAVAAGQSLREEIPDIVRQLVDSCGEGCFEHISPEPIPSREKVIDLIHRACRLLYPGYFIAARVDMVNLSSYLVPIRKR